MPERNDIRGGERCPTEIKLALIRYAGTNPFDEPMYRLIDAASRYEMFGGSFEEWDESVSLRERGGMTQLPTEFVQVNVPLKSGRERLVDLKLPTDYIQATMPQINLAPSMYRPTRITTGMQWFPFYNLEDIKDDSGKVTKPSQQGWWLERWRPASVLGGSKEEWYGEKNMLPDGTCKIGPYPETGDYLPVCGPIRSMPGLSALKSQIEFTERNLEQMGHNPAQNQLERTNRALERFEKKQAEAKENLRLKLFEDAKTIIQGSSLAAGRLRNVLARNAGLKGHFGN